MGNDFEHTSGNFDRHDSSGSNFSGIHAKADVQWNKAGLLIHMAQTSPDEDTHYCREKQKACAKGLISSSDLERLNDAESTLSDFAPWVPEEANPILLRWKSRLSDLGSPEGSIDANTIESGQSWKTKRTNPFTDAQFVDFAEYGWPSSEGPSKRWVTREEHVEILRRLKNSGLTRPGSEVLNIGMSLSKILQTDFPETPWLVDGLVRQGGAAMVYGMSGIGKTWFTLTLILLAAHGNDYSILDGNLKAGGGKGAKVLLLDGEMIIQDLKARTAALVEGMHGFDRTALENIIVYPKAAQDHRAEFFDLADRDWLGTLMRYVKSEGIGMVVLDNLATLSPSLEDENAAAAWSPLNDAIVALKREGVATLLVHHAGKGDSYRGSSNIVATLETVVGLKETEKDLATESDARFWVGIEKSRNYGSVGIHRQILQLRPQGAFGASWTIVDDVFGRTHAFCDAVRSLRCVNQQELGAALGYAGKVSQPTVSRILKTAEAQGRITREEYNECLRKARVLRDDLESSEEEPIL